jgi:molybdopterin/thiamine biosynthesis adenylyltransferase
LNPEDTIVEAEPSEKLKSRVTARSTTVTDPAQRQLAVLADAAALALAAESGCSVHDIYVAALEAHIWPHRYIRNHAILSVEEQRKLAHSRVAVIGAGGLGGTVILLLARMGIGHLTVVDSDVFDESNLNRQAVSTVAGIGRPKPEEAAKMVAAINPAVRVRSQTARLDRSSAAAMLDGIDVVVDALDNVPDRLVLDEAARRLEIPLVHGAIAGFDGRVMTVFPEDPGLTLLYGSDVKRGDPARPEAVLGVPTVTPSVVASLQAMEVVKILTKRGEPFRKKLLHIDLESGRFEVFSF